MRFKKLGIASALISVTMCAVTAAPQPSAATAADGCLPTNGLMNLNAADDLLVGKVRVTSSVTVDLGASDSNWAQTSLGDGPARLLYSLKWVEELVREHRRTGDKRYIDRAVEFVLDFDRDNPVDGGPDPDDAWYPMYAGQRTTAIACVAAVTGDTRVLAILQEHSSWLAGRVGGLQAWNQAIDPYLGLLMGGCMLDHADWREAASAGLSTLIVEMIDGDGVLVEQAPGYGRFIWERWGVVEDELAACGLSIPDDIPERRSALLEWLGWMSAPDGTVTPTGDSYRTIEPPTPPDSLTEYSVSQGAIGVAPTASVKLFSGGYVVGRDSWADFATSTYWTLRFGPGRDLHGHEDHTAVTFWAEGREILIDSGHGGYGDATYRAAMQSPEAHNVLTLPGVDFRIRRDTEHSRSDTGDGWRFDEVVDDVYGIQGDERVNAPRTRGVLVLLDDDVMVVQDRAARVDTGAFEQLWHLVPGAEVVSQGPLEVVARHPSGAVDIHLLRVPLLGEGLSNKQVSVVEGQTDPILGWYSEADKHREVAPVVRFSGSGTSARMITIVTVSAPGESVEASSRVELGGWVVDIDREGASYEVGIGVDGSMTLGPPDLAAIGLLPAVRCSVAVGRCG